MGCVLFKHTWGDISESVLLFGKVKSNNLKVMSKFLVSYVFIEWFPLNGSGLTSSNYTELSHLYENFKDKGTLLIEHSYLFIFLIFFIITIGHYLLSGSSSFFILNLSLLLEIIMFCVGSCIRLGERMSFLLVFLDVDSWH